MSEMAGQEAALKALSQNVRDFWAPTIEVQRLKSPPTSDIFLRDFVRPSIPVVIEGGMRRWPAMHKWSAQYLSQTCGQRLVSVNFTPDGLADAVKPVKEATRRRGSSSTLDAESCSANFPAPRLFVKPEERKMTMASFFKVLIESQRECESLAALPQPPAPAAHQGTTATATCNATRGTLPCNHDRGESATIGNNVRSEAFQGTSRSFPGVPYLSKQNDSLRHEFAGALAADVPGVVDFAAPAFRNNSGEGAVPDAVNLWIGDGRSATTTHQDHYENMYCVVRGCKKFTLFPPSDVAFLRERPFRSGTHRYLPPRSRTNDDDDFDEAVADSGHEDREPHEVIPEGGTWIVDVEDGGDESVVNWVDERVVEGAVLSSSLRSSTLDSPPNAGGALCDFATAVTVEVREGEMLYLPAMWFHRVEQTRDSLYTIAVNYWHDMSFAGPVYPLLRFLRDLTVEIPTLRGALRRELEEQEQEQDKAPDEKHSQAIQLTSR